MEPTIECSVLVRDALGAGRAWVAEHAAPRTGFRGAFFSGSSPSLPAASPLPVWSDVDIVVVVADAVAPAKLGKLAYGGALLDVSYLPWAELVSAPTVATSYHLAASFSSDQVIADPTGHLGRLRDDIAPRFGHFEAVQRRCDDALGAIVSRLRSVDPAAPWQDQVTAWMFPTSITTHVVLVAALRNPTVRLRYVAARQVLAGHGEQSLYQRLLELLGCAGCDRQLVQKHLDGLAAAFDEASAVARTPMFFSTDITSAARPIAIEGSQHLVDNGDHREAVFWIIATWARCQQILAADASPGLCSAGEQRLRAAVTELLGVADTAGLRQRRTETLELLPVLRQTVLSWRA